MSQININGPDEGDRAVAAGINLLAVLIVLIVLLALAWFLFAGPLRGAFFGTGNTNININPPTINVNPPASTNPGANPGTNPGTSPGGGTNGGSTAPMTLNSGPYILTFDWRAG